MKKVVSPMTKDQFNVRFTPGMREKIAKMARANGRSMNSEIVVRLAQSLGSLPVDSRLKKVKFTPRLMRKAAAAEYIGVSIYKFDKLRKDPQFPRPLRVDTNIVAWDRLDLDQYVSSVEGR